MWSIFYRIQGLVRHRLRDRVKGKILLIQERFVLGLVQHRWSVRVRPGNRVRDRIGDRFALRIRVNCRVMVTVSFSVRDSVCLHGGLRQVESQL